MAIATIVEGQPHPLGWVKTRLRTGDELGSFGSHKVPPEHDLARLYGISAQKIVEGNGVIFDTEPINEWVMRTGGKRLSNGQEVFADTSVIYLPPGGPRPPFTPGRTGSSGWLWVLLGLGAAGGLVALASSKKKGERGGG